MAIKWTNKSAINREIDMAERHTDPGASDNARAVHIPFLNMQCPKYSTDISIKEHLDSFNFNLDSCNVANTLPRVSKCLSVALATKMLLLYTIITLGIPCSKFSIVRGKMLGADATPNGSLEY